MSSDDGSKKPEYSVVPGPETIEMEKGGQPLFSDEEFQGVAGEVITGLEETQAQESVIRFGKISQVGGVGSTMVPSGSQEEEIKDLLGLMGKTGDESPGQPLRAFVRSGGAEEDWKPASVVEAEAKDPPVKKQVAGSHKKLEVYASKVPVGTPLKMGNQFGLPPQQPIVVKKPDGGSAEKMRPPYAGPTMTTPLAEVVKEASVKEEDVGWFEEGQRLGDTMVDVEPSWFNRNRGKTAGIMILALVVGIMVVIFLGQKSNISEALTVGPRTVGEQIEQAQVQLERLNPPTSPTSSEEGEKVAKVVEEPDPTALYEGARDIADSVKDRAEEVLEGMPVTPKEKTPEAKVADKVAEAEEPLPKVVEVVPTQPPTVVKLEDVPDSSDEATKKVVEEETTSMTLEEVFAVDLTAPRNKRDCFVVADRANSDEMGVSEGFACCENLRKIQRGREVMAGCRNLVRTAIEEEE